MKSSRRDDPRHPFHRPTSGSATILGRTMASNRGRLGFFRRAIRSESPTVERLSLPIGLSYRFASFLIELLDLDSLSSLHKLLQTLYSEDSPTLTFIANS